MLSKDWEEDVDLCPHEWSEPIRKIHGITVHRCLRIGCLGFHSSYRTSLRKFIQFIRSLPKLPLVPVTGYVSPREIARALNGNKRTVLKYSEVILGFETDGILSYIKADSKLFIYRDDPEPGAPPILVGPLSFAAIGGGFTAVASKGDPFFTALMIFFSGLLGCGIEAWWRDLSRNMQQVPQRSLRSARYDHPFLYPE